MAVEYVHRLLDKQRAFFNATEPECCYSGAYGAGKTRPLLIKLVYRRLQHRRAIALLGRAKFLDTMDTLVPILLEWDGDQPPILVPGQYVYTKADRTIRVLGGGLIRLVGFGSTKRGSLDNARIRGHNVTDLAIDQAEELLEKQYIDVTGRLRAKGDGMTRQANLTCNPSSPSHWLAKRFGFIPGTTPAPGCWGITAASAENPHLPADYMARLNSFTGVMHERYVLGRWVAAEGAIYDNFRREVHVKRMSGPFAYTLIGCDDGVNDPAAYYRVDVDHDGRAHFSREVYARGLSIAHKKASIRELARPDQVRSVVVDPSAATLKLELRKAGYVVLDADNAILPGIAATRDRFGPGPDGKPRTTIDPACERMIEEVENYLWDPDAAKETPVPGNDHACDVLRYISAHLYRPPATVFDSVRIQPSGMAARGEFVTACDTRSLDYQLAEGKRIESTFKPHANGGAVMFSRPLRGREYHVAVVASAGGMPTLLAVGDSLSREVVLDMEITGAPADVARKIGVVAWAYGSGRHPAATQMLMSAAGTALRAECSSLSIPVEAWAPTAKELSDAVVFLRGGLAESRIVEHDDRLSRDAGMYVWRNTQTVHVALADEPERRGTWADRVLVRTLLLRMLDRSSVKASPDHVHPFMQE